MMINHLNQFDILWDYKEMAKVKKKEAQLCEASKALFYKYVFK